MSVSSRAASLAQPRESSRRQTEDDGSDDDEGKTRNSDSEEDSDEDSDDDNAGRDVKRPAASWSVEEQDSVMAFYGLTNMYPQTWAETRDEATAADVASTGTTPASGDSAEAADGAASPVGVGNDEVPLDTSDPLGIRDSIINRPGRRRRSHTGGPGSNQLASLLISSRTFDPKLFLEQVHKTTSYRNFETGADNLREAIDHKEDVIKNLVKTHFAKFVSAKSTIDSFYDQMKAKNLISSQDYGIAPFDNALDAVHVDATTLYKPLLDRRVQAEKIRSTLAVLSQWKFFFNLPSVLRTCLQKKKYDALVRDYQKGAYLMQSSFGESHRRSTLASKDKDALLPMHHQVVFEKVWNEVLDIVKKTKEKLFQRLGEEWTSLEVQEKYLTYLIDLNAEPDPVYMYLEKQYEWIRERLLQAYAAHTRNLNDLSVAHKDRPSTRKASTFTLTELRRALNIVRSQEFESAFADDLHVQLLRATQRFVRTLCDIVMDSIPEFWKVCRMYSGSRLQKSRAGDMPDAAAAASRKRRLDSKKLETCHARLSTLINLFTALLSRAFYADIPLSTIRLLDPNNPFTHPSASRAATAASLPDLPPLPSKATHQEAPPPLDLRHATFLAAHPLSACFFLIKAMAELVRAQEHLKAIRIAADDELMAALTNGIQVVRTRAIDIVCSGLLSESRGFHRYEDWSFEQDTTTTGSTASAPGSVAATSASLLPAPSSTTPALTAAQPLSATHALTTDSTTMLKLFYRLHTYVLRCLHRITGGGGAMADMSITRTFDESMFAILDGLLWGATCGYNHKGAADDDEDLVGRREDVAPGHETRALMGNTPIWKRRVKDLDISQTDVRILVTLCNLQYLRKQAVPKLVSLFHDKLGTSPGPDYQNLLSAMQKLDSLLFSNYIRRTSTPISTIIRNGVLFEGLDWAGLTRPQEVRPYVFRLLLQFVAVHATVSAVSRALVARVLQELFSNLATDLLAAVRTVEEYSWGGLLQATLETQFVHQTLASYERDSTTQVLALVYDSIERGAGMNATTDSSGNAAESPVAFAPGSKQVPPNQAQKDEQLSRVKMLLAEAKRATSVQFSCFREGQS
ncbi:hypothetical protein HDU87_007548 [Geranomyces variabilis]|uniref:Exocyst complex component SEC5 n=1 Tax=Geranomyces variabilis TaxID=109894 RepID=A0AAD5XSW9_9FUNG|nr:hypothetical protein HDU87_007548 [Geranomyces variabilis]